MVTWQQHGHDQGACSECGNSSKYGLVNGVCDECASGETAYRKTKQGRYDEACDMLEAGHDVDMRPFETTLGSTNLVEAGLVLQAASIGKK